MDIGTKLKNRRIALGKTLEEVGTAVGVGKSTVRKWEQGMIQNMRRDKIALLAAALEMNPAEIIDYQDPPSSTLTAAELQLINAYRAAEDTAQKYALEMLLAHPRVKAEESLA